MERARAAMPGSLLDTAADSILAWRGVIDQVADWLDSGGEATGG